MLMNSVTRLFVIIGVSLTVNVVTAKKAVADTETQACIEIQKAYRSDQLSYEFTNKCEYEITLSYCYENHKDKDKNCGGNGKKYYKAVRTIKAGETAKSLNRFPVSLHIVMDACPGGRFDIISNETSSSHCRMKSVVVPCSNGERAITYRHIKKDIFRIVDETGTVFTFNHRNIELSGGTNGELSKSGYDKSDWNEDKLIRIACGLPEYEQVPSSLFIQMKALMREKVDNTLACPKKMLESGELSKECIKARKTKAPSNGGDGAKRVDD